MLERVQETNIEYNPQKDKDLHKFDILDSKVEV